jgi:Guanine nucleotide exchange factor in Golgi transport N-terminal
MFVVDKVVEEDRHTLLANELESITGRHKRSVPPRPTHFLSSRTSVCWGTESNRNSYSSSTSTRPLLSSESVLTNYHTTSSPCSKDSNRSAFPLALRRTHIVFHSLKQFSSELETEAAVILTLLIIGETDAGEPQPGRMRVLAMEIMYK